MSAAQLRLAAERRPGFDFNTQDPTRRVFEHWLFMNGRLPYQCKLGPTRRQAIDAAIAIGYDVEQLLLAVEGMAADTLADVDKPRMRDAMREIEWLLGREARIERWMLKGQQLRDAADAPAPPAPDQQRWDPNSAEAMAGREKVRALAERWRAGRVA